MIRNLKKNDMVRRASIAIDSSKVAKANQVIEGQDSIKNEINFKEGARRLSQGQTNLVRIKVGSP